LDIPKGVNRIGGVMISVLALRTNYIIVDGL